MRHGSRTNLIILVTAVLMLAGAVTAVFAHEVELLESTPANGDLLAESPPEVIARFSEELVSGESTIIVNNAQGAQVDKGDGGVDLNDPDHASMRVSLAPLPDGVYTVEWHAVLLDGDATDDAFAFTIGDQPGVMPADTPPEAAEANQQAGISTGVIAGAAAGLVVLLLVSVLIVRRRQS